MENKIEDRDWAKIERNSTKVGLREGLHDGRDSNFQTSFDQGFADGFQNAFKIGQYNGALFAKENQTSGQWQANEKSSLLNSAKTAWCQLCSATTQIQSIPEIQQLHQLDFTRNLSQLHSKHAKECNISLPK